MYIFLLVFRHYNNLIKQDADNGISLIILETKLFSHTETVITDDCTVAMT